MKTHLISLMLVLVFRCSGQIPFIPNFSGQSSTPTQIKALYKDKTIDINEKDSIVFTLNFKPDSVSNVDQNKNFAILNSRKNFSTKTVNQTTETQSTYTYVFTPITTTNFKFPSPMFYMNGIKYTTDSIQIKVIHRELTEEEIKKIKIFNLTNTLNNADNTMQIVFNDELGYICIQKNGKFIFIKELNKNQVEKINKIIK